jgi:hypothetical protein
MALLIFPKLENLKALSYFWHPPIEAICMAMMAVSIAGHILGNDFN